MAQEIADSKLLDTWGSSGTKIEPDVSKIIEGWQLGEQPPHEYMNWLQNTFGSKLNHILKNGIAEWNNETEYLAGSSVKHSGSVWLCETTNTNSEPTELNANWEKVAINKDLTVTVDTLANLRNISYPANTVWASGYHTKNDGAFGSHIFRLKGVKTTETDNSGTVIVATIGGVDYVYELQYDGAVNVKWFGVKNYTGNETFDNSSLIQSCINSLSTTGGTICGTRGEVYRITSGITNPYSNVVIDLDGSSIFADWSPTSTEWAVSIGDGSTILSRIGICNGRVYTTSSSTFLNGVRFRKNVRRDVHKSNLIIYSFKGIGLLYEELNWSSGVFDNILIENCGINMQIDDNSNAVFLAGYALDGATTYNLVIKGVVSLDIVGGYNQNAGLKGILIDNSSIGSLQISSNIRIRSYFENNGTNHIEAKNGYSLVVDGSYFNCNGMTGSAIKLSNWTGAKIDMNRPANLTSGTPRDFVEADASCTLISVGKQAVSSEADTLVCFYAGSLNGIIKSPNTMLSLPTPSNLTKGAIVLIEDTGTASGRSTPYINTNIAPLTRSYRKIKLANRKQGAVGVTSPYVPNLSQTETFDMTVPNTGLLIENPTGTFFDGDEITFLLKQSGTGGGNVTWGTTYKTSLNNTGNAGNTYASATFIYSGGRALWIEKSKMQWTA